MKVLTMYPSFYNFALQRTWIIKLLDLFDLLLFKHNVPSAIRLVFLDIRWHQKLTSILKVTKHK